MRELIERFRDDRPTTDRSDADDAEYWYGRAIIVECLLGGLETARSSSGLPTLFALADRRTAEMANILVKADPKRLREKRLEGILEGWRAIHAFSPSTGIGRPD